jgi:hypothetical protein
VPTAPPLAGFVAREKSAYTAMGDKVFVWGGNDASAKNLADGAIYSPATDSWAAISATAAPSARVLATAVWTGSVVVVWGGGDAASTTDYSSGSRYDPLTNSWQVTTTLGAPPGRRGTYGVWTGSRVLFFGGADKSGNPSSAIDLYDPVNDTWSTSSVAGQPTARTDPTIGWSGSLLLYYGGRSGGTSSTSAYTYDATSNIWRKVGDGPSARYGALGTWDGSLQLAWSGNASGFGANLRTDGKLYDPVTDKWTSMQTTGDPSPRLASNRQTGWSVRLKPRVTLLLGGLAGNGNTTPLTDGSIYNSTTNAWAAVAPWPSGAAHLWGVGVWTGTEFVIWGGRTSTTTALTSLGERFLP